jgi:hypothetical protein
MLNRERDIVDDRELPVPLCQVTQLDRRHAAPV